VPLEVDDVRAWLLELHQVEAAALLSEAEFDYCYIDTAFPLDSEFNEMTSSERRAAILDCGGKRSATPLSHAPHGLKLPHASPTQKRRRRCALSAQSMARVGAF
jgi:hypothetical protein